MHSIRNLTSFDNFAENNPTQLLKTCFERDKYIPVPELQKALIASHLQILVKKSIKIVSALSCTITAKALHSPQ